LEEWNGDFELVDPNLIVVDHRYQRPEKMSLIATIAKSPNWAAFGALSLFRRGNGVLVCIDGQQRLRGILMSEKPPKKVPAVIQPEASREEEASTFVLVNIIRKAVDPFEKHKALIEAKSPVALAIERAVDKAGYTIGTQSGAGEGDRTVHAIAALYWIYDQLGEEGLVQVLTQARDAWPNDPAGVGVNMLRGICELLIELGADYNRGRLTNQLAKSSPHLLLRKADEHKFDFGGSKQKNLRRAFQTLCGIKQPRTDVK